MAMVPGIIIGGIAQMKMMTGFTDSKGFDVSKVFICDGCFCRFFFSIRNGDYGFLPFLWFFLVLYFSANAFTLY
jgi:hypothetical protein